ncbi:helix-turn-helix domain-containing protein [Micrococcales bacterium 31B]|nr:helix-turn-helix domain-containing protein [Micrococcales bacterium 31B]
MATHSDEVREFLSTRRARITPEQAGLPAFGGNRRVKGLRREEVAMLAGVSVDYYVRLERGNLAGASESVLESLSRALRLDPAEHDYLLDLARTAGPAAKRAKRMPTTVRPVVHQMLEAMHTVPAWVRNGRHDIVAANTLGRALYAPVFDDPRRPVNTARFVYLNPAARSFWPDYDEVTHNCAAMLRSQTVHTPHDPELITLIGELSTHSETFRTRWASHDVKRHFSGVKRINHPVVGLLELNYESMALTGDPGLVMNVYTAPVGTPSADGLALLASWAATQRNEFAADVVDAPTSTET